MRHRIDGPAPRPTGPSLPDGQQQREARYSSVRLCCSSVGGLVTTIIPVFNRASLLREAVASVLAQTYRPIEIIVVDDGSTDHTGEVADELQRTSPTIIRVIHQQNRGPGPAREAGRLAVSGDYVQYLDSDDLLLPDKFALQVAALEQSPHCGIAYGWTRLRQADGSVERAPWKRTGETIDHLFPSFLTGRWWDTSTPLYRASIVERSGAWLDLKMEEDWEYDCRIATLGISLASVADWVSETRIVVSSISWGDRGLDPEVLRSRATAHGLILGHALTAGVAKGAPEMEHFSRELFLLARQCGAAGLTGESQELFHLARTSTSRRGALQLRMYATLAGLFGWRRAGKMAEVYDRLRS